MLQSFNVRLDFATSDHRLFADAIMETFRGSGPVLSTTRQGQVALDVTVEAADPLDAIQRAQSVARGIVTAPIIAIEVMPTPEFDARVWGVDIVPEREPRPAAEPEGRV